MPPDEDRRKGDVAGLLKVALGLVRQDEDLAPGGMQEAEEEDGEEGVDAEEEEDTEEVEEGEDAEEMEDAEETEDAKDPLGEDWEADEAAEAREPSQGDYDAETDTEIEHVVVKAESEYEDEDA